MHLRPRRMLAASASGAVGAYLPADRQLPATAVAGSLIRYPAGWTDMSEQSEPTVRFYRLILEARPPQRADRSAAGTLPTRAYRYCAAVANAAAYGWWIFPPTDLRLYWDGHDIYWHPGSADEWLPLQ